MMDFRRHAHTALQLDHLLIHYHAHPSKWLAPIPHGVDLESILRFPLEHGHLDILQVFGPVACGLTCSQHGGIRKHQELLTVSLRRLYGCKRSRIDARPEVTSIRLGLVEPS